MPTRQHGVSPAAAYRPTSLDFINLPNPIEPSAGSQKHPLNGTPRLEKVRLDNGSNPGLLQLILDAGPSSTGAVTATGERPEKRQKTSDNTLLDLPKLPVRNAAKRMRIPPTLSGLHQPPPDAGLLPSINVEKPQQTHALPQPEAKVQTDQPPKQYTSADNSEHVRVSQPCRDATGNDLDKPSGKRAKRNKWTDDETQCLLKGVARFGIGNWTKIVNCEDYDFNNRTALDLKDRFRVCRPDDYSSKKRPVKSIVITKDRSPISAKLQTNDASITRGPLPERISTSKLMELGIDQPFAKSSRRQRHRYSDTEDEALLEGFRKYGNSWASIRSDVSLGLSERKATDLRDRFRTKYPDEYSKAGLTLRQEKLSSKLTDGAITTRTSADPDKDDDLSMSAKDMAYSTNLSSISFQDATATDVPPTSKNSLSRRAPAPALFSLDDVFLGAHFGEEEYADNGEPIILDRGILDWAATDSSRALPPEPSKNGSIDPLMTLKLPRLASTSHPNAVSPTVQLTSGGTTSLPSLAAMVSAGNPSAESSELPGLPSLVQWINTTESEMKMSVPTSNFPTLDELLS